MIAVFVGDNKINLLLLLVNTVPPQISNSLDSGHYLITSTTRLWGTGRG